MSRNSVYEMCRDVNQRLDLPKFNAILHAIESITGEPVRLEDVLDYQSSIAGTTSSRK